MRPPIAVIDWRYVNKSREFLMTIWQQQRRMLSPDWSRKAKYNSNYLMSRYLRFLIPLAVFGILVAFLGRGLSLNPREVPSPLIGKPVPVFELPQLHDASSHFSSRDMLGKVWLLNVWASWCAGCRQEHRDLMTFAGQNIAPLVGLNYKELRGDGAIDSSQLEGKCGLCEFRNLCGGSRSRAYALTGNYLAEDPRCAYQPKKAACAQAG